MYLPGFETLCAVAMKRRKTNEDKSIFFSMRKRAYVESNSVIIAGRERARACLGGARFDLLII